MSSEFKIIKPEEISDNTFKLIGKDWMLITAGTIDKYNTMTASWGGLGILWHKNVCFCVIRPQRYTYEFIEAQENFTLSFFDEKYKDALSFCGANSGRDYDKASEAGITPVEDRPGMVYFDEARLVVECKKIYYQDVKPENILDDFIGKFYEKNDYHRMYVGEIKGCYVK